MATDKIPSGPKAPARRRSMFSTADDNAGAEPTPPTPTKAAAKPSRTKSGWDRRGQVSVVLGGERHERLEYVWRQLGVEYDTRADLIRAAIDEKLDRIERKHNKSH